MNWLQLAWANLRHRALGSFVNVMLMALGTASIVLLLLAGDQFAKLIARDAQGIDLVIGAKGSPLQLILSSVYHADVPTGNVPLHEAQQWAEHAQVAQAVPLALGDSYKAFRIVGTTRQYAALYQAEIQQGEYWHKPLQAVLGATVAEEAGLVLGDMFSGSHGLADGGAQHADQSYQVVGVLAPTGRVIDRLILTDVSSVWALHGEHAEDEHHHEHVDHEAHAEVLENEEHAEEREITAMLVRYGSPLAALSLPRQINASHSLQAAAPAVELTRLLSLVGFGLDALRGFAVVLLLTAAFSIFAALYGALESRRADLAMLRCLGASRAQLMMSLLLEGLLLSAGGLVLGFALGHAAMAALSAFLQSSRGIVMNAWVWLPQENLLMLALLLLGLVAAGIPAWQAYRQDVARTLAKT